MNFELFESMSLPEAQEHLQYFLDTESDAIEAMRPAFEEEGLTMDYSIPSVSPILKWVFNKLRILRVPVPDLEPEWIRQAHKDGLIDFPDESRFLLLRASYYLGESFVRTYSSLHWTTGNPEFIEKNMPVVAGFQFGKELAPMMIVKNVFKRVIRGDAAISHVDVMLETWQSFL